MNTPCIVTITPGTPLNLTDGTVMQRATAECNVHGVIIAGSSRMVIEYGMAHADPSAHNPS